MLKRKLILIVSSLVVAFIVGTGRGGILADVFGVDIGPAVYAAEGCDAGGGC